MILNIANPHNVLAFYESRADLSGQGALSCPASLLPFQLKVNNPDTFFQVLLVDPLTLETVETLFTNTDVAARTQIKRDDFDDSTKYLTYFNLSDQTTRRGNYRIKIIHGNGITNTIRYSHLICIEDQYEPPNTIAATTDGTTVTITPSSKGGYSILYLDTGTGFELIGQDIGTFLEADISGGGTIKVNTVMGNNVITNLYTITSALVVNRTTENTTNERLLYLEFWNSTDIQPKNLIYQTGYKQRFYFFAYFSNPQHIIEENFIRLSDSKTVFASASEYQRISFEIYPFPVYLSTVLGAIKYHDNYKLVDVVSEQEYTIYNPTCNAVNIEEVGKPKGQLSLDINHAFTTACEANKTPL